MFGWCLYFNNSVVYVNHSSPAYTRCLCLGGVCICITGWCMLITPPQHTRDVYVWVVYATHYPAHYEMLIFRWFLLLTPQHTRYVYVCVMYLYFYNSVVYVNHSSPDYTRCLCLGGVCIFITGWCMLITPPQHTRDVYVWVVFVFL